MSRYLILILLNLPLVIIGFASSVVSYKVGRINKRRFIVRAAIWLIIAAGLIFSGPLYAFLFSNNLTQTEPLSLFDVIQITGIIFTFLIANQAFTKADAMERKLNDLHQEISIKLSGE